MKEQKTRDRLDALKAKKKKPRREKEPGAWMTTNPEAHRDWFWALFCEDQLNHLSTLELLEKPAPEQFVAVRPEHRISSDASATPGVPEEGPEKTAQVVGHAVRVGQAARGPDSPAQPARGVRSRDRLFGGVSQKRSLHLGVYPYGWQKTRFWVSLGETGWNLLKQPQ